jgi:hypothetical protein
VSDTIFEIIFSSETVCRPRGEPPWTTGGLWTTVWERLI